MIYSQRAVPVAAHILLLTKFYFSHTITLFLSLLLFTTSQDVRKSEMECCNFWLSTTSLLLFPFIISLFCGTKQQPIQIKVCSKTGPVPSSDPLFLNPSPFLCTRYKRSYASVIQTRSLKMHRFFSLEPHPIQLTNFRWRWVFICDVLRVMRISF